MFGLPYILKPFHMRGEGEILIKLPMLYSDLSGILNACNTLIDINESKIKYLYWIAFDKPIGHFLD